MENDILSIEQVCKLNSREISENYMKKHHPGFYKYLNELYGDILYNEKIFLYKNRLSDTGKCSVCGKPTKFINKTVGYSNYCSCKCANSDPQKIKKQQSTTLQRYGVLNISQNEQIKKKKVDTCNLHYDGGYSSKIIREKAAATCIEKHGDVNYRNIEKSRHTRLDRYGSPAYTNREKAKATCMLHYGVVTPFGNDKIIQKSRETKQERYGNKNFVNSDSAKQTKLIRYGNERYNNTEKIKNTLLERYGVENAFLINKKENQYKASKTCIEKYGVPYFVLSDTCKSAVDNDSKPNNEFAKLLENNNIDYSREFVLENRAYDFKVGNILIEIDPFATHNSTWGLYNNPKDKNYHWNKSGLARKYGYRCIHIWDWDDKNKILHLLQNDTDIIYARKCEIKEVSKVETDVFLNAYHLQGTCSGKQIRLGLYYNGELVYIITFGKPRYNKNYEYELLRLCSSRKVVGGAERLFTYFINTYKPKNIISYCDNSKFSGSIYNRLGFILKSQGCPSKHWYNGKLHITDNLLRQRGFDQIFKTNYGKGTSNEELMLQNKFVEIYDCGQSVFVWSK